ncbi:sugar phosphate isomerase/epimerase [Litorivicinus sp.]|nr:sugar phosphate isomerase/epimerase [Litorivicinus sp.]MDC1239990.1 sugar phosphate isomerase/epimerase [Litorivicinus sp.]
MIYVSTACVKFRRIDESVLHLAKAGFKNIELTGGTHYYDGFSDDLLRLKSDFGLSYFLHNYFPPPTDHFVLNLASMDDELYRQSIDHCIRAIRLCRVLGSDRFGVHAGFLIDFSTQEAGKKIRLRKLNERAVGLERFCNAWELLLKEAGDTVKLYVENNVLSQSNAETYERENPFLLTDFDGFLEMKDLMEINLLLDLAHLKVSARSLNLDFAGQASALMQFTDYVHVSGNDGRHDQNLGIEDDVEIMAILEDIDTLETAITLEVYDGVESVQASFSKLSSI